MVLVEVVGDVEELVAVALPPISQVRSQKTTQTTTVIGGIIANALFRIAQKSMYAGIADSDTKLWDAHAIKQIEKRTYVLGVKDRTHIQAN